MTVIILAMVLVVLAMAIAAYRMVRGPADADRATAADMVFVSFVALAALIGLSLELELVLDVVLVATLVGFLATLAMARLVTGGKR